MKLPNGVGAVIGEKLERYSLNSAHPEGQHKARRFAAALGITVANAVVLRDAVMEAARGSDEAVEWGNNGYGIEYHLPFRMQTATGSATIRTCWIIRRGEDFPRLTSCYIVKTP